MSLYYKNSYKHSPNLYPVVSVVENSENVFILQKTLRSTLQICIKLDKHSPNLYSIGSIVEDSQVVFILQKALISTLQYYSQLVQLRRIMKISSYYRKLSQALSKSVSNWTTTFQTSIPLVQLREESRCLHTIENPHKQSPFL